MSSPIRKTRVHDVGFGALIWGDPRRVGEAGTSHCVIRWRPLATGWCAATATTGVTGVTDVEVLCRHGKTRTARYEGFPHQDGRAGRDSFRAPRRPAPAGAHRCAGDSLNLLACKGFLGRSCCCGDEAMRRSADVSASVQARVPSRWRHRSRIARLLPAALVPAAKRPSAVRLRRRTVT
ncbi:MAG: hypothetical protein ACJ74O_10755 [Frankiaceae bacterium]